MSLMEQIRQHAEDRVREAVAREEADQQLKLARSVKDQAAMRECLDLLLPGLLEQTTAHFVVAIPSGAAQEIGFWCRLWLTLDDSTRILLSGSRAILTVEHVGSWRTCPVHLGNDTDANWKDFIEAVAYATGAYGAAQKRLDLPISEVLKPRGRR